MSGVNSLPIGETPLTVIDLETTGLHPNGDSIVEIGIVRVEPGSAPVLVLDTLVDPRRHVTGTEIHGITDADVRGAPTFEEVAPGVLNALDGAVLAAYNVYFDTRFLQAELSAVGVEGLPPHLCLMYMRPLLGIGKRCSLADACAEDGLKPASAHVAADDALTGARLWERYLARMTALEISIFADLASRKSYKFLKSFNTPPLSYPSPVSVRSKSRREAGAAPRMSRRDRLSGYWSALKAALADLEFTSTEVAYLREKAATLGLDDAERRWLHARAFAGVLASSSDDQLITDSEVELLHGVAAGLRELGWAPGDSMDQEGSGRGTGGLLARWLGRG